jgi:hypothetical protein
MSLFYHMGILGKYCTAVPRRSLYDFATDLIIFNREAERKKNRTGNENQIRIRLNSVGETDPQRQTIFALYFNETAFTLYEIGRYCF